ncbi:hypothetical protein [Granulosicoccus antarcticus]|uniref:Uncharacterized protein n=1 Tax=Granulosicoccus antarcticus IMCC3135 TaxID=1192854 RepID=A0A2Z2NQF7_9GAMM|nr:hypothetical protein [Granulosicoccus antarcticus]ASJ73622.1 hypothetical protein IMCC3135_17715 [Granulosicoccus antarcticus IMCC3135]
MGYVSVNEDVSDNEVTAEGTFVRYASDIAGNLIASSFTAGLDLNACTVETIDSSDLNLGPDTSIPDLNSDLIPELVSAGEALPFSSSAGSYIELQRNEQSGFIFYTSEPESVPGPTPSQLTLNIPGDVFPEFSNVDMPTVEPLIFISPEQGQSITPATNFSWTPGTNADAHITISAANISFAGTALVTVVTCVVTDDGQFSFPSQTQSDMGDSFNSILGGSLTRQVFTFQQQGNTALILTATSSS